MPLYQFTMDFGCSEGSHDFAEKKALVDTMNTYFILMNLMKLGLYTISKEFSGNKF